MNILPQWGSDFSVFKDRGFWIAIGILTSISLLGAGLLLKATSG